MKTKLTILTIAALQFNLNLLAQEQEQGKHQIFIGAAAFTPAFMENIIRGVFTEAFTLGGNKVTNSNGTGGIFAGYHYFLTKKISIGGVLCYEQYWGNLASGNELIGKYNNCYYTLAVEGQYVYNSQSKIQLYSGLGLCGTINHLAEEPLNNSDFKKSNITELSPLFHINLLGIRFGRKFGFSIELGGGYKGIFNYGFSYKF